MDCPEMAGQMDHLKVLNAPADLAVYSVLRHAGMYGLCGSQLVRAITAVQERKKPAMTA